MMNFRGLELHGKAFWSRSKIERALSFIQAYDLTDLVIHDSDFMTDFFFPTAFFNPDAPWSGAPARRGENALHNNREYFRDILKRAKRKGVGVWLEVKEITFPDEIIARNPEIMKNGVFCPTDPLWEEVMRAKYADLVTLYPEVKGVIVSPGSPEGKTSLSQNKCNCERCRNTELADWYLTIMNPMYEVLSEGGMRLAVREFSYNLNHQEAITSAVNRMPEDVIYCIKVTPHDFYPTFPDNSLVAEIAGRPKWIEYDTMGQYYGWGIIPCAMMEDIDARFSHALKNSADGALMRVEWERINDYWSLDSINRINLHAAANASKGIPNSLDHLLTTWLEEEGIVYTRESFILLRDYLKDSWGILKKSLYVNDFVLNDSSMVPLSIERAWWSMADKHSLAEWFPERMADLDMNEEKTVKYIDEKTAALEEILEWKRKLEAVDASSTLLSFLRESLELTSRYVRMHLYYGKVCLLSGWFDREKGEIPEKYIGLLDKAVSELENCAMTMHEWLERSDYPHQLDLLFNSGRCMTLVKGARQRRESIRVNILQEEQ